MVELLAQGGESRFFVHANILVSQSQPFKNALAGNWKEATERKIDLNDWDGDTVGRLVEFLYRGNYQYPDPAPISAEDATTPQGSHGSSGSLAVSGRSRASTHPERLLTGYCRSSSGKWRDGNAKVEKIRSSTVRLWGSAFLPCQSLPIGPL